MFSDLILFDKISKEKYGFSGFIKVDIKKIKDKNQLKRLDRNELNLVEGGSLNREILENRNVDVLLSPEKNVKNDFLHHRDSGLNHILCKIASKNNIAIGINFNDILNLERVERSQRIGRIMQNIRLCRKFKVKIVAGSFAKSEDELRNLTDLASFLESIGMTPKEAKDAFRNMLDIIENKKSFIADGVKLVR